MIKVKRFGATWCAPCKVMALALPKVIENFSDVEYAQFDVEKDNFDADKYSFTSIPYISIEDGDGVVVKSFTGVKSLTEMSSMLLELGATLRPV